MKYLLDLALSRTGIGPQKMRVLLRLSKGEHPLRIEFFHNSCYSQLIFSFATCGERLYTLLAISIFSAVLI